MSTASLFVVTSGSSFERTQGNYTTLFVPAAFLPIQYARFQFVSGSGSGSAGAVPTVGQLWPRGNFSNR